MEIQEEQVNNFRNFAEATLHNHLAELHTKYHYQNRQPDRALFRAAYHNHGIILEKELQDQIAMLTTEDHQSYLKQLLLQIKNNVIEKLNNEACAL